MADWNNDNPNTWSMSFDLKPDKQAIEFFNSMAAEFKSNEEALKKRIKQLFDEFIAVDAKAPQKVYEQTMLLFEIGYQFGWNDHYELMKEYEQMKDYADKTRP